MEELKNSKRIEVSSLEETAEVAASVAVLLKGGMLVALCGPLGAGKTTFVRLLASQLGSVDPVSSPSFVVQHEYNAESGLVIEHWDLYRLNELEIDLEEPPSLNSIRIVEWADKFSSLLEGADLVLNFDILDQNSRAITWHKPR